ncbi:Double-stranded RNA-binding domain [Sesbania bispinosa]|nr:Double-stranded RNA-binding domain [Sesbania bispinosa]
MYKNQLQELAQRSCFNLPSYTCIREGPDHAPRFKATVNFNGEIFESPHYCSTLRQAEHSAAEVALNSLSHRGPSHSLAAKILDETGVYKNLLQEIAQRVGAPLPQYTTYRSGLGHLPVFTGIVELAGITFTGDPAKNKKQAEKNAAMAAWSSLKQLAKETASSSTEPENNDELEQITIARALLNYRLKEKMSMSNPNAPIPFQKKFQIQNPRPTSSQSLPATTSKILPLICQKTPRNKPSFLTANENPRSRHPPVAATGDNSMVPPQSCALESRGTRPLKFPAAGAAISDNSMMPPQSSALESRGTRPLKFPVAGAPTSDNSMMPPQSCALESRAMATRPLKFPAAGAAPYVPIRQMRSPCQGIAPAVTVRTVVPVFSAPPLPPPASVHPVIRAPPVRVAPPVNIRQAIPVFAAPPARKDEPAPIQKEDLHTISSPVQHDKLPAKIQEMDKTENSPSESETMRSLEQLKI